MIIWIVLFLLIIGVSFILAFRSMKDYQEIPRNSKVEYGLFLIRKTESFNVNILNSIGKLIFNEGFVISIERLFKGHQAALTIFGPKKILDEFTTELDLLELEDYTLALKVLEISVWEVGVKDNKKLNIDSPNNIFMNLSELGDEDQFFWQVILGVGKEGENLTFQTQIRAVVYSKDPSRKKVLTSSLQELKQGELTKIPKPFSTEQMMDFYHLRVLSKDSSGPILNSEGIIRLLKV